MGYTELWKCGRNVGVRKKGDSCARDRVRASLWRCILMFVVAAGGPTLCAAQDGGTNPRPREETPPPVVKLDIHRLDGTAMQEKRDNPGIAFLWNADNDNGGNNLDKDAPEGEYAQENDLHKLTLTVDPTVQTGTVKLEMIGHGDSFGSVKIWTHATKKTLKNLPLTWTVGQDTIPTELWVEGVAGAHNLRDVQLKLSHVEKNVSDSVRITVVPLIPVVATVEGEVDILSGAAWKPDGSYCLMAGKYPRSGSNGRVGKYVYPQALPTILDTQQQRCFWESAWKPNGTFAVIGGTTRILKFDGSAFASIQDSENQNRTYWDAAWKPGGDYAFLPAERPGFAYKCDGNTTTDLQMPECKDAHNADWHPKGLYVLCHGDSGCHWKWTEAGWRWTELEGEVVQGSLVTKFHPSGDYALTGCTRGRVYRYAHATNSCSEIRAPEGDESLITGICWHRQGNYAILVGSRRPVAPHGRQALLYNHRDPKFCDVDVHVDEKPFCKASWHPSENLTVGAVHNSEF